MSILRAIIMVLIGKKSSKDHLEKAKDFTDDELVKKVLESKDSQLFGILYDRYSNKVFNKCISFTRDHDEAKDLVQDIFLKVFMKLGSFAPEKAAFSTWLYTVTYNYCSNYVTRDKSRNYHESMEDHEYHLQEEDDIDIEEINSLEIQKLERALEKIPPKDKALLLLKYQDDTSIKEIQNLSGLNESAVKMRLNRAKAKVVEAYKKI